MAYDFNPFTGLFDDKGKTTATLDARYVNVTGDTMQGTLDFSTNYFDLGILAEPATPAADSAICGGIPNTLTASCSAEQLLLDPYIYPHTKAKDC